MTRARTSLAALATVGVTLAAAPAATATAGSHPGYTDPVVAIPTAPGSTNLGLGTGGEPRLLVTRSGHIVVAAHYSQWDCVTGRATPGAGHPCVWQSTDDGASFQFSGGEPNRESDDVDLAESKGVLLESIMTNPAPPASQAVTNLAVNGLGGTTVARSADGGKSWTEVVAANSNALNDRPFILAVPDGGVILSYDSVPGGIMLVHSADQGLSWGLPQIVGGTTDGLPTEVNGAPAIDPQRHKVIIPYALTSSPDCAAPAAGCFSRVFLARGDYDGTGWVSEPVPDFTTGHGTQSLLSAAVDASGAEYLASCVDGHIRLQTQLGPGAAWTTATVDPPAGTAMTPIVAAGRSGRVVVAYYWSPYADAATHDRPWYAVVGDSRDSGRTFRRTTLSGVVWTGAVPNHQPVLWDLFGLAIDTRDRVHAAWTQVAAEGSGGPLTEIAYSRQDDNQPDPQVPESPAPALLVILGTSMLVLVWRRRTRKVHL